MCLDTAETWMRAWLRLTSVWSPHGDPVGGLMFESWWRHVHFFFFVLFCSLFPLPCPPVLT